MARLLRVWLAILVLLGASIGSLQIGPVAVLQGLTEESREWGVGEADPAEELSSQWALLNSKRGALSNHVKQLPEWPRLQWPTKTAQTHSIYARTGQYRLLPRVLLRRTPPDDEPPTLA